MARKLRMDEIGAIVATIFITAVPLTAIEKSILAEETYMKVLIITSSIDYTVDYIISRYSGVDFYRINTDMFEHYQFLIRNNGWSIESAFGRIEDSEVQSIYYRKPMLPDLSEFDPAYHSMIAQDILGIVTGLADSFDGPVLSKPYLLQRAENKTYQLLTLRKLKIPYPLSAIGNTYDLDTKLMTVNKIIKPLTQGKIDKGTHFELFQTNRLTQPVGDISLTPVYIQEFIEKAFEVRITCLDNYIWPVRIVSSNRTDWRRLTAKNTYDLVDVPDKIKGMCLNILKLFDLHFGAFDFIVTSKGEWYFLEINPNGQWLWLEEALNLDISKRIVELLNKEGVW